MMQSYIVIHLTMNFPNQVQRNMVLGYLTKQNDSNHWTLFELSSVPFTLVVTLITWMKSDDGQ